MDARGQYLGLIDVLRRYWRIYGGLPAMLRSPFVHLSIVLTALTAQTWLYERWWLTVIAILPNLLGFTLGGFAVFLGFGDDRFRQMIAGSHPDEPEPFSPYLGVSATFLHFVLVQILALLWALTASSLYFDLPDGKLALVGSVLGHCGGAVGYWLFLYGLFSGAAAAIAIFRVAGWYDAYRSPDASR